MARRSGRCHALATGGRLIPMAALLAALAGGCGIVGGWTEDEGLRKEANSLGATVGEWSMVKSIIGNPGLLAAATPDVNAPMLDMPRNFEGPAKWRDIIPASGFDCSMDARAWLQIDFTGHSLLVVRADGRLVQGIDAPCEVVRDGDWYSITARGRLLASGAVASFYECGNVLRQDGTRTASQSATGKAEFQAYTGRLAQVRSQSRPPAIVDVTCHIPGNALASVRLTAYLPEVSEPSVRWPANW
jgi:hypothetical protein